MSISGTKCNSPFCALGPCRTSGELVVASADEVPLECPNRNVRTGSAYELDSRLAIGAARLTPNAAQAVALISRGSHPGAVGELLRAGRLTLLEPRVRHPIHGGGIEGGRVREDEPPTLVAAADEVGTWIKFKVVDDETNEPIDGVALHVVLPSGRERDYVTRADGKIEIEGLEPGTCDVSSELENASLSGALWFVAISDAPSAQPPEAERPGGYRDPRRGSRIAIEQEYKVQTGDSLESVATANGIRWQQLAEFNWDTSSPRKINEHLRDDVGCTRKTADGQNYIFDSSDDPGIITIPKRWEETGLETQKMHVIRVTRPYRLEPWHFSI